MGRLETVRQASPTLDFRGHPAVPSGRRSQGQVKSGVLGSPSSKPLPEDSRAQLLAPLCPQGQARRWLGWSEAASCHLAPDAHPCLWQAGLPWRRRVCPAGGRLLKGRWAPSRQADLSLALARRWWKKEIGASVGALGDPVEAQGLGGGLSAASPGRAPEVRDRVGLSAKLEPRGPGGSQAGPQRATGMEVSLVTLKDEAHPGAGPEWLHHLLPPAQDQDCLPRHHTEFLCLR